MLTDRDISIQTETGLIPPDRLRALQHALCQLAADADAAARAVPDAKNAQAAAALRGKRLAYREAALMVQHILDGHALHPRAWSAERQRNRFYGRKRQLRRVS